MSHGEHAADTGLMGRVVARLRHRASLADPPVVDRRMGWPAPLPEDTRRLHREGSLDREYQRFERAFQACH